MKKWTVLIRSVGSRDVEAKDIDGAYAAARDNITARRRKMVNVDQEKMMMWHVV